jgi:flagellin
MLSLVASTFASALWPVWSSQSLDTQDKTAEPIRRTAAVWSRSRSRHYRPASKKVLLDSSTGGHARRFMGRTPAMGVCLPVAKDGGPGPTRRNSVGIRINQNIMAMNSYRNLTTSESQLSKSLEKLSSGYRINKAADDASGLVISEGLRSQVMGLKMAIRNTQDGVSVVQTAEGALTEVHSLLQRVRELAVQAASTGSSDPAARDAAQAEVEQLLSEIDRISNTTKFGGQTLLDGNYGVTQAAISGTAAAQTVTISATARAFNLDVDGTGGAAAFADVTLTGTSTYDAAVAGDDQLLEDNINAAILTKLGSVLGDPAPVVAEVTTNGLSGAAARFVTTFRGTDGNSIGILTPTTAAEDILVELGIASTANANSSGTGGVFQVGTDASDTINFAIANTDSATLGIDAIDVSSDASGALALIDDAITDISVLRGDLGALQNRFEHTIANLSVTVENLSASESRIRDTDMASEMMSFTRAQILQQAGTAMLAQANAVPQSVLQLLQ